MDLRSNCCEYIVGPVSCSVFVIEGFVVRTQARNFFRSTDVPPVILEEKHRAGRLCLRIDSRGAMRTQDPGTVRGADPTENSMAASRQAIIPPSLVHGSAPMGCGVTTAGLIIIFFWAAGHNSSLEFGGVSRKRKDLAINFGHSSFRTHIDPIAILHQPPRPHPRSITSGQSPGVV